MKITNNMSRPSAVRSLKAENDDYSVIFFYFGNYDEDKKNNSIETDLLSMNCKSKDPELPELVLITDQILIHINTDNLTLSAAMDFRKNLLRAEENVLKLHDIVQDILIGNM